MRSRTAVRDLKIWRRHAVTKRWSTPPARDDSSRPQCSSAKRGQCLLSFCPFRSQGIYQNLLKIFNNLDTFFSTFSWKCFYMRCYSYLYPSFNILITLIFYSDVLSAPLRASLSDPGGENEVGGKGGGRGVAGSKGVGSRNLPSDGKSISLNRKY